MTENIEWAEHLIRLQPLTRKLEESINRKEWDEAARAAEDIAHAASRVGWYANCKRLNTHKTEGSYYG